MEVLTQLTGEDGPWDRFWSSERTTSLARWRIYGKANKKKIPRHRSGRPATTWLDRRLSFWLIPSNIDLAPTDVYEAKPKGYHRGEVPVYPEWRQNLFILSSSLPPVALQVASYLAFPNLRWHWAFAFLVYLVGLFFFLFSLIRFLHFHMGKFGTFDEANRARDLPGDHVVHRVGKGILFFLISRIIGVFVMSWDSSLAPAFNISTIPKIVGFLCVLDYYFYVIHRSYHQFDILWKFHRLHHSVQHPTPTLAILSDNVQETGETIVIPLLALCTIPWKMSFHELWLACVYLIFVEAAGHSGVRATWGHPLMPFLRPFGMQLEIEHHDLHHRYSRAGGNLGKQTLIFDRIFGTVDETVEHQIRPLDSVAPLDALDESQQTEIAADY